MSDRAKDFLAAEKAAKLVTFYVQFALNAGELDAANDRADWGLINETISALVWGSLADDR